MNKTDKDGPLPPFTQEPNPLDRQIGGGHYKKWTIQPLEFVEANKLSWFGFVILKYLFRIESKMTSEAKQIEDLEKIIHYSRLKQLFLSKDGNNIQHNDNSETSKTF